MSDDREWVTEVTGGRVTRFEQTTAGRSRATWLVDVEREGAPPLALVLRRDTGDGPLSGTELSLERESTVYRALLGSGVRIPRLWGIAPDGAALLVERVEGTENTTGLGAARAEVIDSFLEAVATLHGLDVSRLDLPGFDRPATPEDHALLDLALWQRIFDDHVDEPAPLVRFALRWLHDHPPAGVERTVLCHGDLGPGNFLHAGGRVTAILDWEFAHLGDPMDDIAWFTIRAAQVAGMDDLGREVERYEELTGTKVDAERVAYYQIMVLARMAVACLVGLRRRTGKMDVSTYLALLPLLHRQLATLLAEQAGCEVSPTEIPAADGPTSRADVIDVLSTDLGSSLLPELTTAAARSRAMGMMLLLMHLKAADGLGAAIDRAEVDDLAAVLGERPASAREGWRALDTLVASLPPGPAGSEAPDLIAYFSRRADRHVALWPPIAAIAARPLPKLAGRS